MKIREILEMKQYITRMGEKATKEKEMDGNGHREKEPALEADG